MKKLLVTISLFFVIFIIHTNAHAFTCTIVNEEGNPITTAQAGDVVYLKASYINLKSGKMAWKFIANLPTINSKTYKTLINKSGYYYHVGTSQEKNNFIPLAIPAFDYIKGTVYFVYTLSKAGKCSVPLYISEYVPPPATYTITAMAGANGSITPSGTLTFTLGQSQTFTITPNTGYHIADVTVDGASVGAVTSHSFTNITSDHTISAAFAIDDPPLTPNYSGQWSFQGALMVNDCDLSGLDNTISATNTISHSGNNVVLISGAVTFTGTTNDKDGFDVYSPLATFEDGCTGLSGYRYEGASDGNAVAALAIVVDCGSVQCNVGYGGTSVRQINNNALSFITDSNSTLKSLMDKCAQQTLEKRADSSKKTLPLDEESLKATVTDIAKAAISEKN